MSDIWEPVAGSRFFTRNGTGLYERLTPQLYLRVDDLDEADEVECCRQFARRWVDETAGAACEQHMQQHARAVHSPSGSP
jgi:hypothetical protein